MHRLRLALFTALIVLLAPLPRLAAGDGFYAPARTLLPSAPDGMISDYAGVSPRWEAAADGASRLVVPAPGRNEVNLVWTYWGHTRPEAADWTAWADQGELRLRAGQTVTVRPSVSIKVAGDWTAFAESPSAELSAGRDNVLPLSLPPLPAAGQVEAVRLLLVADEDLPELVVSDWSVGGTRPMALSVPGEETLRTVNPVTVSGRVGASGPVVVRAVASDGRELARWTVQAAADGRFELPLDRSGLPAGLLRLQAASVARPELRSGDVDLYVYPVITPGRSLPPVVRDGRHLLVDGKPWGFAGFNYTRFSLGNAIRADFRQLAEDFRVSAEWGVTVLRIPLHLGMIQPEPGVFPDHPRYADILRRHKLDPRFFELLDYAVALAGAHGMRLVLEWHEMPDDPYRYFVGGNEQDRGSGKPGNGIAWLYDAETRSAVGPGEPRWVRAIVDTNRWMARHFKGNGNILGFEVPYNEPHSVADSSEAAWRRITAETIRPIRAEDPARLTFAMPPAWGHGNVMPSVTWQLPDELDGMAPHYYLGNGPVPVRPDASTRPEPWLARDVAATFDHSFAAVALPHSAAPWPVWNGESGEHGYQSLFPELTQLQAAPLMIEAQLVQAYAAGMCGSLGWTLTGHETIYEPLTGVYAEAMRRFAPVFTAGPVDYARPQVLFVQNPAAVPGDNGLNQACTPLARLALDLHLGPVHYMSDDQLLYNGLVQLSSGLEQVESVAAGLHYKAVVVDTRNLDSRALELLAASRLPVLKTADAAALTADELAGFLSRNGVEVDRRTPAALQLIAGPRHLLVYRRSGDGAAKVYPNLGFEGRAALVDEDGREVFAGTAEALRRDGLRVDLPKWRTAIFRIEPRS